MATPGRLDPALARQLLVRQLQLAFSGELAAALAYRGHSRSVRDREERERIATIESEEWHHRRLVGGLLRDLDARPAVAREVRCWVIGRVLGALCHVSGWFAPMYGAGKLERRNVGEYEDAARYAVAAGQSQMVECLLAMAETEWEHERFFRDKVEGHRWLRFLPLWPALPPKTAIRSGRAAPAPSPPPAAAAAGRA